GTACKAKWCLRRHCDTVLARAIGTRRPGAKPAAIKSCLSWIVATCSTNKLVDEIHADDCNEDIRNQFGHLMLREALQKLTACLGGCTYKGCQLRVSNT